MDITAVLEKFVSEELLNNTASVTRNDNLLTDGLVDSLGMMRFIRFIEDTYDLEIPPEDVIIENFRTIGVIIDYLHRRQA